MTITPMTAVPAAHAQQLGLTPVETLDGKTTLEGIINVWRAFIREGGDYRTATGIVTNGKNDFWVAVVPPQDNPTFNLWSFIMPKVAPHWTALTNSGPRLVSPNLSPVTLSQIVMPTNAPLAAIGTPDALAAALRAPIKDKTISQPGVADFGIDAHQRPVRKSLFDHAPAAQPTPVVSQAAVQPEEDALPDLVLPEPPAPAPTPAPVSVPATVPVQAAQAPAPAPTPAPVTLPPAPSPIDETRVRPTAVPVAPTPVVTSVETSEDDMTGFFDDDEPEATTYSLHSLTTEETWPILTRPVVIGRSSTRSEISVSRDSSLSRSHAQIYEQDGQVIVTDLGSKNGTHIGSHRLQPHTPTIVPDGALLRLGHVAFNVVKEQA